MTSTERTETERPGAAADDHGPAYFPFRDHMGFRVGQSTGGGVVTLDVTEEHMNPHGVVHGAVPFALMDTAMGSAVMDVVEEGQLCATIEIQTRFHRSTRSGTLRATATVLNAGRSIIHLEARTVDDLGRLVASATGSFAILDRKSTDVQASP
ncbi:MAG: PaaI family thioesterase [Microthrixaceae bacterium]